MNRIDMEREHELREIAYALWEQEGRPSGRDLDHYFQAERLLDLRTQAPVDQIGLNGDPASSAASKDLAASTGVIGKPAISSRKSKSATAAGKPKRASTNSKRR